MRLFLAVLMIAFLFSGFNAVAGTMDMCCPDEQSQGAEMPDCQEQGDHSKHDHTDKTTHVSCHHCGGAAVFPTGTHINAPLPSTVLVPLPTQVLISNDVAAFFRPPKSLA